MGITDGKNRSSKKRQSSDIRNPEGDTRIVGVAAPTSVESGNDQIRISRENSQQANTTSFGTGGKKSISGKIIGQLIKETERQLAYHETQASELQTRLKELHQLNDDLGQEHTNET